VAHAWVQNGALCLADAFLYIGFGRNRIAKGNDPGVGWLVGEMKVD